MRQIANSLHVVLTVPKRFEQAHFDWVMSKYPLADSPFVPAHAEEVRGRFPYRGEEIDLYITICHRHRRMLNALANQRDRAGVLVKCASASGANLPQDMYLRVGMTLLGCTKNSGHRERRALHRVGGHHDLRQGADAPGVQARPVPVLQDGG